MTRLIKNVENLKYLIDKFWGSQHKFCNEYFQNLENDNIKSEDAYDNFYKNFRKLLSRNNNPSKLDPYFEFIINHHYFKSSEIVSNKVEYKDSFFNDQEDIMLKEISSEIDINLDNLSK